MKTELSHSDYLLPYVEHFFTTGDSAPFIQAAYAETDRIINQVSLQDTDFNRDYFLHFLIRLDQCLLKYRNYRYISFSKFYAVYIKNDFRNYLRNRKRKTLSEILVAEPPYYASYPDHTTAINLNEDLPAVYKHTMAAGITVESEYTRNFYNLFQSMEPENFYRYSLILDCLEVLPASKSAPYRLTHGIPLTAADTQYLVQTTGNLTAFELFWEDYQKRKETEKIQINRNLDNLTAITTSFLRDPEKKSRLKSRKNLLRSRVLRKRKIVNARNLSDLLGIPQGTLSKRIQKVEKELTVLVERRTRTRREFCAETPGHSSESVSLTNVRFGILAGSSVSIIKAGGEAYAMTSEFRTCRSAFYLFLETALKKNRETDISLYMNGQCMKHFKVRHRNCLPLDTLSEGNYSIWAENQKIISFSIK